MTTIAIIGAGKGLGAAVARRFGKEGFAVGLISRHQGRLDALAAELEQDGVQAKGFVADVRDPASIAAALEQVTETLGPIEVLQYSPLPQKDFMRPVLETTPADLTGPIEFSIYGPVAAVHQVLPGMRFLPEGSQPQHPVRQRRVRGQARTQRHRHVGRVRRPGGVRRAAARGARRGGHLRRPADHRRPDHRGRRGEGPRCPRGPPLGAAHQARHLPHQVAED